jgi:hypothetical protein
VKRKVKWCCPKCYHEHRTRWSRWDCFYGPITMECEKCGHEWLADMRPDERWVKRWRAYA